MAPFKKSEYKRLGDLLKHLRMERNLSVETVCQRLAAAGSLYLEPSQIHRLERGEHLPPARNLRWYCIQGLKLSIEETNAVLQVAGYAKVSAFDGLLDFFNNERRRELYEAIRIAMWVRSFATSSDLVFGLQPATNADIDEILAVSLAVYPPVNGVASSISHWKKMASKERLEKVLALYPGGIQLLRAALASEQLVITVGYAIYYPVEHTALIDFASQKIGYEHIHNRMLSQTQSEQTNADYCIDSLATVHWVPWNGALKLLGWVHNEIQSRSVSGGILTFTVTPQGEQLARAHGFKNVWNVVSHDGEETGGWLRSTDGVKKC